MNSATKQDAVAVLASILSVLVAMVLGVTIARWIDSDRSLVSIVFEELVWTGKLMRRIW